MSAQATQNQPHSRRPTHRIQILAVSVVAAAAAAVPFSTQGAGASTAHRSLAGSSRMRQLEAHGYIPTLCTRKGTLMVNSRTGRRLIVTLS